MMELREIAEYLLLAVGLGAVVWGVRNLWRTQRILSSGGISVGEVFKTRVDREGEAHTSLRFRAQGDRVFTFEQEAPSLFSPLIFARSQIGYYTGRRYKVFYDIAQPRRATISPKLDVFHAVLLMGFGLLLTYGALAT